MRRKPPASSRSLLQSFGLGVKVFVALEAVGFLGCYIAWKKMNTDRDFRYKVYQTQPYILNYYYKVGETLGGISSREEDYKTWGIKKGQQ